jgi:hypothetical protein
MWSARDVQTRPRMDPRVRLRSDGIVQIRSAAERRAAERSYRAGVPAATSVAAIAASALGLGAFLALVGAFGVVGLTAMRLAGAPTGHLERS